MEDVTKARIENLTITAHRGTQIREWMLHPGWGIFKEWANKAIQKDHNVWLKEADSEKAEQVRQDARWYFKFDALVKKMIIEGDAARISIDQINKEEKEANG